MIEITHTTNLVNFSTSCFTSRHHEISNKIYDLTTLCASCHECFDYIKTLHPSCRRSAILASHPSSLRFVNNPSSRKRLTTLSYHKLYTQCFTSRHHVISNKIHDLSTLCASCHECFDYIKTLHIMSSILRSMQRNTSSLRLVNATSSQNFTRVSIVDRFDFFLNHSNHNFVS